MYVLYLAFQTTGIGILPLAYHLSSLHLTLEMLESFGPRRAENPVARCIEDDNPEHSNFGR